MEFEHDLLFQFALIYRPPRSYRKAFNVMKSFRLSGGMTMFAGSEIRPFFFEALLTRINPRGTRKGRGHQIRKEFLDVGWVLTPSVFLEERLEHIICNNGAGESADCHIAQVAVLSLPLFRHTNALTWHRSPSIGTLTRNIAVRKLSGVTVKALSKSFHAS